MIILVLLVVLGYTYFGGPKVPKILKDYKEMLLGVFVGILLHQFFGFRMEGWDPANGDPPNPIPLYMFCPSPDSDDYICSEDKSNTAWISSFKTNLTELINTGQGIYTPDYAGPLLKYSCPEGSDMVKFNYIPTEGEENTSGNICIPTDNPIGSVEELEDIHIIHGNHDSSNPLTASERLTPANTKVVVCPRNNGNLVLSNDGTHYICQTE